MATSSLSYASLPFLHPTIPRPALRSTPRALQFANTNTHRPLAHH